MYKNFIYEFYQQTPDPTLLCGCYPAKYTLLDEVLVSESCSVKR